MIKKLHLAHVRWRESEKDFYFACRSKKEYEQLEFYLLECEGDATKDLEQHLYCYFSLYAFMNDEIEIYSDLEDLDHVDIIYNDVEPIII